MFSNWFLGRSNEKTNSKKKIFQGQLQSEDYGKDLTSVQNLLKKHALVEADVNSHQDRVDGVKIASEQFCTAGHFDSKNIQAKHAGKLKFPITKNTS